MEKTIVLYESKYGSTRQYATWIAEALSCPVLERKKFRPSDFSSYEIILYGGGLYAGGISGISLITKNQSLLSDKKLILFTCGLADPANPENVSQIRQAMAKAIAPEILQSAAVFHFRGGIDYTRLSLLHRTMMSIMRKMLLKKEPCDLSSEDRGLLDTYGKCVDFSDPESIRPLVEFARTLKTN